MWLMEREYVSGKIRDLEVVHGILMHLRFKNVVRDDKELDNWMRPVEEQVQDRIAKLRLKVPAPKYKKGSLF